MQPQPQRTMPLKGRKWGGSIAPPSPLPASPFMG